MSTIAEERFRIVRAGRTWHWWLTGWAAFVFAFVCPEDWWDARAAGIFALLAFAQSCWARAEIRCVAKAVSRDAQASGRAA